uniref:Uncharacterized protein n=1 Tax=Erythrolobus madagascarensis TaxID=708628 RepID=A0A7S0T5V3_9RHOD|mmetsp:Transcript_3609/g.7890  ORF Transcript_3609/g.7890 Transcript_3609/m.7890 type:complete len:685 (+) Transcript_3609:95-2149(+)
MASRVSTTREEVSDNNNDKKKQGGFLRRVRNRTIDTLDSVKGSIAFPQRKTSVNMERSSVDSKLARMSLGGGAARASSDIGGRESGGGAEAQPRFSYALDEIPQSVKTKEFKEILSNAKAGKTSVVALLETMFLLEENLPGDVYVQLFKFLSRLKNLRIMVKLLVTTPMPEDSGNSMSEADVRLRERSPYVVSMVLSSGPYQIRRVLSLNPALIEQLLKYFDSCDDLHAVGTVRVSRVVFALLNDSPLETIRLMTKRKNFVKNLTTRLYSVPVAELLPQMFSTSKPDSLSSLRFGAPNIEGILLLGEARVHELIADAFELAEQDRAENGESYKSVALIENGPRCIGALTMRAMATSHFEPETSNLDRLMCKRLNAALDLINIFHQPEPLIRMLDVGLAASKADPNRRCLRAVVNAIIDTLFAYHSGIKSPSPGISRAVQSVNLDPFEDKLGLRIPALTAILRESLDRRAFDSNTAPSSAAGTSSESRPIQPREQLGSVKLKVIEMLVFLFAFQTTETVQLLVESETPQVIFGLFLRFQWNNMLQNLVAMSIEASLIGRDKKLKIAWLKSVGLMQHLVELWARAQNEPEHVVEPVAYRGWLIRVSKAVDGFLVRNAEAASRNGGADALDVTALVGAAVLSEFEKIETVEVEKFERMESTPLGGDELPKRTVSILRNLAPAEQVLI